MRTWYCIRLHAVLAQVWVHGAPELEFQACGHLFLLPDAREGPLS
jgi:hypothetical protein